MVIYLFIAVSHIFYLSNNTSVKTNRSVSLFKRKIENVMYVNSFQRTDKATIKESNTETVAKVAVLTLSFPFISGYSTSKIRQAIPADRLVYGDNRYTYISLCTFRI